MDDVYPGSGTIHKLPHLQGDPNPSFNPNPNPNPNPEDRNLRRGPTEAALGKDRANEAFLRHDPPQMPLHPDGLGRLGLGSFLDYMREVKAELGAVLFETWLDEGMKKVEAEP